MSKLYVFGIGGTGSRVLKALTVLLASGLQCDDEIVPVILDPDAANADLTKTVQLIDKYNSIQQASNPEQTSSQFFRAKLDKVQQIQLPVVANQTFEMFVGLATMTDANKALMKMLYSDANLGADMSIGFTGNPSMGSVVLNQFESSATMKNIATNFQQGDKIFIISSIFGGTGASGFPLLLKTLRSTMTLTNFGLLNIAPIGAITIMPYFSLQQDLTSPVDPDSFMMKTKAALSYYLDTMGDNNGVLDSHYYIGDDRSKNYAHVKGGASQANDAHFVELISALAVLHFSEKGKRDGKTDYFEFGIKGNPVKALSFGDLESGTKKLIQKPLTQMFLFCKYLNLIKDEQFLHQPWAIDNEFDENFFGDDFYKEIHSFLSDYDKDSKLCPPSFYSVVKQMANNKRSFVPFNVGLKLDDGSELDDGNELNKVVVGVNAKKKVYPFFCNNNALMDHYLNTNAHKLKGKNPEQCFVELFYLATQEYVGKIFKFN